MERPGIAEVQENFQNRDVSNGRSMARNHRSYPSVLVNSRCHMDSACSLRSQPIEAGLSGRSPDVKLIGVTRTGDSRKNLSVGNNSR